MAYCFRHAIGQFAARNLLYGPNFKENAHFRALNLFNLEKKVEVKLQDVYRPSGLRFSLCPSTF